MEPEPEQTANRLWRFLKPPDGAHVLYFAKKGKQNTGGVINDAAHLAYLMKTFRERGWDAYIQPNPTRNPRRKRSSAKDISHYRWFTADIDPITTPPNTDAFEINVPGPLSGLQGSSFMVNTGRGIQLWWRSLEVEISNETLREHLRYANACMLKEIIVSSSLWKVDFLPDLPRLVRMPQTFNSKTGNLSVVTRWPKEGFDYIQPFRAMEWAGEPPPPPEPPKSLSKAKWQFALPHLSLLAKTFIMEGVDSGNAGNPGRHHAAVAAARSLRDANLPYERALEAVLRGAQRCRPSLDEDTSFTTYEVMRIVAQAYGIEG